MLPTNEIIEKISQESKKSREDVKKLVEEKLLELSGLVSEEGAAYIVARELGLNLLASTHRQLKVENLIPGLRSVDIVARVTKIFPPREFSKNGKQGVVQNVSLADSTGRTRLSLWNEETKLVSEGKIKEDDVVKIERGFTKQDYRGGAELRIGKGTIAVVHEDIRVPEGMPYGGGPGGMSSAQRATIDQLQDGDSAEVRASIVQVYRRNPFYEVCPTCNFRVQEESGAWKCKDHGAVEPKLAMRVSGVIDDGFGSIRVVFFRDVAEKAFGKSVPELRAMMMKSADPLAIFDSFQNLGRDMIIRGRCKKSNINESLEFVANSVEEMDTKKECELLVKELQGK